MALIEIPYDREKAVAYAHQWAYGRNPRYYDFTEIGGDCTNFASQCVYAGCGVMNFTPDYGWYYISLYDRAPAWTSVRYFYRFMTTNQQVGPFGAEVSGNEVEPGDLVQIRFRGDPDFGHTPVIVRILGDKAPENIYVAAHSDDSDYRPLVSYTKAAEFRYIHILGARYFE